MFFWRNLIVDARVISSVIPSFFASSWVCFSRLFSFFSVLNLIFKLQLRFAGLEDGMYLQLTMDYEQIKSFSTPKLEV